MKKIFILAVSAVLLAAGCQKTEIQNEARTPIGFSSQMGKLTKAPDAENSGQFDNLVEQDFRVWGFFATEGDLNYAKNYLYLDKIYVDGTSTVTGETTTYGWATTETYYWPGKGKELDLYAISSWATDYDLTATGNVTIVPDTREVTIKDFVVNANADNDLMVAALIRQDQDDDKYVRPHFEHTLTKVVVKFKASGESTVHVISAVTSEIPSKATLTVANTEPTAATENTAKTSTATFTWGEQSDKVAYHAVCKTASVPVSGVVMENGETAENAIQAVLLSKTEFTTFGSWLLLPQTSIEGYYLDVEYIVDGMYVKQRFMLKAGDIAAWTRNQLTTYNVTISPDYITFEPDVQDWTNIKTDEFDN